jgi:hypothetical protein
VKAASGSVAEAAAAGGWGGQGEGEGEGGNVSPLEEALLALKCVWIRSLSLSLSLSLSRELANSRELVCGSLLIHM